MFLAFATLVLSVQSPSDVHAPYYEDPNNNQENEAHGEYVPGGGTNGSGASKSKYEIGSTVYYNDINQSPSEENMGIYIQEITYTESLSGVCGPHPTLSVIFPSWNVQAAQCEGQSTFVFYEWKYLKKGGEYDPQQSSGGYPWTTIDTFRLEPEQMGCIKMIHCGKAWFVPSGALNYPKVTERMEKHYDNSENVDGSPGNEFVHDGDVIGTGDFRGDMADKEGDGQEDVVANGTEGTSTEDLIEDSSAYIQVGRLGPEHSRTLVLSWDYCGTNKTIDSF